jgi:periplasmic protein TonB
MYPKNLNKRVAESDRSVLFTVGLMTSAAFTMAAFTYSSHFEVEHHKNKVEPVLVQYTTEPAEPVKPLIEPSIETPQNNQHSSINILNELTDQVVSVSNSQREIESISTGVGVDLPFGEVVIGNEVVDVELEPENYPDIDPEFIGGIKGMTAFLTKNLRFPDKALREGKSGVVFVQFVVERDGKISRVKSLNFVSKELNEEAERVIKLMPSWIPGELRGHKVSSYMQIPIRFEAF